MNRLEDMIFARDLLAECGVESWLAFGTLLGLYREGGLIKGDNDIDFVVKMEQFTDSAIKKISKRMKREGYSVKVKWEKKKKIIICKKNELDIAIAGFWVNGNYRLRRTWKIPDRFFSDGTIQYKGHTFQCHSPIEEYLAYIYSNWSVPAPKSDGRKLYNEACLRKPYNPKGIL